MPWHNSGTWDYLPIQDIKTIIANLYAAIHERAAIVTQMTPSEDPEWTTSWGSPTLGDEATYHYARIDRTGSNNLTTLRTLVESLAVGVFDARFDLGFNTMRFVTSDYETPWTLSTLRTAAGYGDEWIGGTSYVRMDDVRPWLQLKNCINELKYIKYMIDTGVIVNGISTPQVALTSPAASLTSVQETDWDNTRTAGDALALVGKSFISVGQTLNHDGSLVRTVIANQAETDIDTLFDNVHFDLPGTTQKGVARWKHNNWNMEYLDTGGGTAIDMGTVLSGGGLTLNAALGSSYSNHADIDITGSLGTLPYTYSVSVSIPDDTPVPALGNNETAGRNAYLASWFLTNQLATGVDVEYGA